MHALAALLVMVTAGWTAQSPKALDFDGEAERGHQDALAWSVPGAEQEPSKAADAGVSEAELDPTQPRLAFDWEGGSWARTDSCNFGVELVGAPAVSADGRYVLHDRQDSSWESDGGEVWQDYYEEEPHHEAGLALVDLEHGTTAWLDPLVLDTELPHHKDGNIHCRKLRLLLHAGVKRINAAVPGGPWRPLLSAESAGIRVIADEKNAQELERRDADRSPIELFLTEDEFILRRKGIEVLHREPHAALSQCNMPLVLGDVLMSSGPGRS